MSSGLGITTSIVQKTDLKYSSWVDPEDAHTVALRSE